MLKKFIFLTLLAGAIGTGFYFGRPYLQEYLVRRQAESESLGIVQAIAGMDAKIDPSGYQGQMWMTTAIPTKNTLYLEGVRTGDACGIEIGKLHFRKLASENPEDIQYYAQSEAAIYYM